MKKSEYAKHGSGYYTQQEWDRIVGYGSVPPEYKWPEEEKNA